MKNPKRHIIPESDNIIEIRKEKNILVISQLTQKAEFLRPIIRRL
jgi:hypothetical protein